MCILIVSKILAYFSIECLQFRTIYFPNHLLMFLNLHSHIFRWRWFWCWYLDIGDERNVNGVNIIREISYLSVFVCFNDIEQHIFLINYWCFRTFTVISSEWSDVGVCCNRVIENESNMNGFNIRAELLYLPVFVSTILNVIFSKSASNVSNHHSHIFRRGWCSCVLLPRYRI